MGSKPKTQDFIDLRYKGKRFEGGVLPLEVLGDFVVYRELVLEIAKSIWREKHPSRRRVPRNFEDYFRLSFKEVSDGSALASVARQDIDLAPLFGDEQIFDVFDDAQTVLLEGIKAANRDGSIDKIPAALVSKLGMFGKRLGSKEKITFESSSQRNSPRLSAVKFTPKTREKIFERAGLDFQKIVSGFGILTGVNETRAIVSIRSDLGEFDLKVEPAAVREVYDGKIGSVVEFVVDAKFTQEKAIKKVVESISLDIVEDGSDFDKLTVRIKSLLDMPDGWLDGIGKKVRSDVASTTLDLARFLSVIYDNLRVYPTEDGGLQLEFDAFDTDVSVEVISPRNIYLHAFSSTNNNEFDIKERGVTSKLLAGILSIREKLS